MGPHLGFAGHVTAMVFALRSGLGCCSDGIGEGCWIEAFPHLHGSLLVQWELSFPYSWGPEQLRSAPKSKRDSLRFIHAGAFWVHSADGHLSSGLALLFPQMHRAVA